MERTVPPESEPWQHVCSASCWCEIPVFCSTSPFISLSSLLPHHSDTAPHHRCDTVPLCSLAAHLLPHHWTTHDWSYKSYHLKIESVTCMKWNDTDRSLCLPLKDTDFVGSYCISVHREQIPRKRWSLSPHTVNLLYSRSAALRLHRCTVGALLLCAYTRTFLWLWHTEPNPTTQMNVECVDTVGFR